MLEELFKDLVTNHTEMQIDSFIVGMRSPYGQYMQAVRELHGRVNGHRELHAQKELLLIDIEELECGIIAADDDAQFEGRRNAIKLNQKRGQLAELNRQIDANKREMIRFYEIAVGLKKELPELTKETKAKLEREEWIHWCMREAAAGMFATGRIPHNVASCIMGLDREAKALILAALNPVKQGGNPQLIDWYAAQPGCTDLPEQGSVELPTEEKLKCLS